MENENDTGNRGNCSRLKKFLADRKIKLRELNLTALEADEWAFIMFIVPRHFNPTTGS